jgi:CHAT domain-containing protein
MRPLVGGGEQTRASFFSQYGEAFNAMVDLQVRAGDVEAAFEYAERGRARVMLDQLQAGKIELRASIPEETRVGLEARERKAKTLLASYQQQITILGSRQDLSAQDRDTQLAVLEDSLRSADNTFSNVYADIKNASPLWRDLITSGGAPVTLRQVQRELVPRNGLMLLYQLGESSSFVFVIGEGRNDVTVLPLDISDEAAAVLGVEPGPLTTAALHLAMAGQDSSSVEGVLKSLASRGTRVSGRRRSSSTDQLHALWTILVPDSSWQQVVLAEEVVVVPDGPLFSLPFEALVVEAGADETTATYWLDDGPVIRYAPSATVLYNLERRPPSRLTPIASETLWLSLYDPIFDLEEIERVGAETSVQHPSESRSRDEFVRAGGSLARLPGTALEALALNTAFGKRVQSLQGLTATEAGLRAALGSKRFLHFATHGLVDETRGSLFASLALTPSNASVIDSENDGYLQLYEIYELPLDEIELAILSACETNLGDSIEGEGVFALSRGFLAAGSRRVVASQWAVDDASTADIMEGFFGLLSAQMARGENVNYGQDLRDAKRLIRSQPEWSSPYFWAPFILTGQR